VAQISLSRNFLQAVTPFLPFIMDTPWTKSPDAILEHFGVDPTRGLSEQQVLNHAKLYGKNGRFSVSASRTSDHGFGLAELPEDPPTPLWRLILDQFQDQLVLILLGSAVISFVLALLDDSGSTLLGAFVEPAVILLILIANATVGVIQETSAEQAIDVSLNPNLSSFHRSRVLAN
jgi:Ca2+ transporting ATPase